MAAASYPNPIRALLGAALSFLGSGIAALRAFVGLDSAREPGGAGEGLRVAARINLAYAFWPVSTSGKEPIGVAAVQPRLQRRGAVQSMAGMNRTARLRSRIR